MNFITPAALACLQMNNIYHVFCMLQVMLLSVLLLNKENKNRQVYTCRWNKKNLVQIKGNGS